jgi:hypothetical protein
MLMYGVLALSQYYFSKLGLHGKHAGRPDIAC